MKGLASQDHKFHAPKDTFFDDQSGYLIVQLDKDTYGLPDTEVSYRGQTFQPKEELHITIVSSEAAENVQETLEQQPQAVEQVKHSIEETDWSYRKRERFYHVVEEPGVESIIQIVEVPGVEPFFDELSRITGKRLELPPTHVTLFTRGNPKGIGLPTQEVFDRLVTGEVSLDELEPQGRRQ